MLGRRASGILCHVTCLPGPFGIGDMGPAAYRFVDLLSAAGQSLWQILPLTPMGKGNSPYMSPSAFAGNPLLVSPQVLVADGLLESDDINTSPCFAVDRVEYTRVAEYKQGLWQRAFLRFDQTGSPTLREEFTAFKQANARWLDDYALFQSLKEANDGRPWSTWLKELVERRPEALAAWRERLARQVEFQSFLQWLFARQWTALKAYANAHDVEIFGDLPIYVAYESADVWANQRLFQLDDRGRPKVIAGVPPDYYSATGQLWGNPIYNWRRMREEGYRWWIDRFGSEFQRYDLVRIDHFRGLEAYWEVPAEAETAEHGRWVRGPGAELFEALQAGLQIGPLGARTIAEDLGVITAEVDALRDAFDLPGMRVLQMAFGTDAKSQEYQPHNHVPNCVVYTGTHDHDTTVGWFTAEPGSQSTQAPEEVYAERKLVRRYCHSNGRAIHWDLIRLAMGSVARAAVVPMQDVLGLGSEARMNRPGTSAGNWEWRFTFERFTPRLRRKLADLTQLYGRMGTAETGPRPVHIEVEVA